MIHKYYIEGIVISSIIYFIYFTINNRFKNSKTQKNSDINLLNYLKSENIDKIKLPNFITTNYFIFVGIFTFIYYKIKIYIKKRYI